MIGTYMGPVIMP